MYAFIVFIVAPMMILTGIGCWFPIS